MLGLLCGAALFWLGLAVTGGATTTRILREYECQVIKERGWDLPPGVEVVNVQPSPCVWRVSRIHWP